MSAGIPGLPWMNHPTAVDILRGGLLLVDLYLLGASVVARRHRQMLDAKTLWQMFLVVLVIQIVLWMLPIN